MDRTESRAVVQLARQLSRARTVRKERSDSPQLPPGPQLRRGRPGRGIRRRRARWAAHRRGAALPLHNHRLLPDRQLRRDCAPVGTRSPHRKGKGRSNVTGARAVVGIQSPLMSEFLDDLCPDKNQPECLPLTSLLSLLRRVPALLWVIDRGSRFISLSGGGLELAGLDAREYEGKPVEQLFAPGGQNERPRAAHQAALQGIACSFHAEVNGRDLQAHLEPLRATDGSVAGAVGVGLDLTDRMVAERALRLSEHSYRSLIEGAPYAICRSTSDGQLLQVNRAMLEMLGYDPSWDGELLLRDLPLIF